MALFDGFDPQGFADRGGMLGRLVSMRPDLALDQQEDQPASRPLAPAFAPSLGPAPASSPNAADSVAPLQLAQSHILQIDPLVVHRPPLPFSAPAPGDERPLPGPAVIGSGALLGLGLGALILSNARKTEESGNEEETVGQSASRPATGSLPIDQTPWSGDHTEIKEAIGVQPAGHVSISPKGYVWGQNPDGSWTNHGPASSFTGSGKPSGQRGKDRGRWR
jgi:hypothetical protein